MAGWNKREREQKKRNAKQQKEEKRQERKENSKKGKGLDEMLAYVDDNGNLTDTPPDKRPPADIDSIPPTVANSNALQPTDTVRKGVVSYFDPAKGYGFIRDLKTQESFFAHINASSIELKVGLNVSFEVQKGPRGFFAANITASA